MLRQVALVRVSHGPVVRMLVRAADQDWLGLENLLYGGLVTWLQEKGQVSHQKASSRDV